MIANLITSSRYLLSVLLVIFVSLDSSLSHIVAFAIFCVIGLTDVLDGYVARHTSRTPNGAILDPLADEFAVVTGIICLLYLHVVPLWFAAVLFWSRSIFGLVRILSVLRGGPYAGPQLTTKAKMGFFYAGEAVLFGSYALSPYISGVATPWLRDAVIGAVAAAIVIALWDFVLVTHRSILLSLYQNGD